MARKNRRARRDSYLNTRGRKNRNFLLIALALLILAGIGFYILNSMMDKEIKKLEKDIISSQKKLDEVNKEIEDLKNDYEMRNTDEFKEKLAEEKLGMVKKEQASENKTSLDESEDETVKENSQDLTSDSENPASLNEKSQVEEKADGN